MARLRCTLDSRKLALPFPLALATLTVAVAAGCAASSPDRENDLDPSGEADAGAPNKTADAGPRDARASEPTARADAGRSPLEPGEPDDCVRGQYTAQARPLDMFILLDQSGSMLEDEDRWTPTTTALTRFVDSPDLARTGIAIQYFPIGKSDKEKCEVPRYALPDVAMAELPGNAPAIRKSIEAHHFTKEECCDTVEHSGTPTRPAFEGAASYMREWLKAHPERAAVILLATDGEPSDVCDANDVEDVAGAIAAAASATPAVKTYVVGIGDNDALDEMAAAGGTGEGALIVDGSGMRTEQQFLEAVSRIRKAALPCDYPIEAGSDPSRLNLEWTKAANDAPVPLVNVRGAAECEKAGAKGWYFDNPAQPARVNLCPATCSELGSVSTATVRVVEGCETMVLF